MKKPLALFLTLLIVIGCSSCVAGGGAETQKTEVLLAPESLAETTSAEIIVETETVLPETTEGVTTEAITTEEITTEEITTEVITTEAVTTGAPKQILSLNKKRVMFVGNSYTYWGFCVSSKFQGQSGDNGYFYQVAKSFGDNVTVTNFVFPNYYLSHSERGAYQRMLSDHPDYYNNPAGKTMDVFYKQNYVILQQTGSNQITTYADAKKIMALFPPETVFCYYVTTNEAERGHKDNLDAAKKLHEEDGVIYIPIGHLAFDLWRRAVKIPGTAIGYSRTSFIVAYTSSDGFHPNYLTGYLTALTAYCAITGQSAVGAKYSYVSKSMTYYVLDTSNYDKILDSEYDMTEIQKLVDKYIADYNK